jgi:hypothetical protein
MYRNSLIEWIGELDFPAKVFIDCISEALSANSVQSAIGRLFIAGKVSRDFPNIVSSVFGHSISSLAVPYPEILDSALDLLEVITEDFPQVSNSATDIIVSLFQGPAQSILSTFLR